MKGPWKWTPALWAQPSHFTKGQLVDVNTKYSGLKHNTTQHNNVCETSKPLHSNFAKLNLVWHNNLNALVPLTEAQMFNQLGDKKRLDLRCIVQVTHFFFLSSGAHHNTDIWLNAFKWSQFLHGFFVCENYFKRVQTSTRFFPIGIREPLRKQIAAYTTRLWHTLASLYTECDHLHSAFLFERPAEHFDDHIFLVWHGLHGKTVCCLWPTSALHCQRCFLICLTRKTFFANNILKLFRLSGDLLFICIHQYHPAVSVTPGTLNLGSWLVASISKWVHYPFRLYVFLFWIGS